MVISFSICIKTISKAYSIIVLSKSDNLDFVVFKTNFPISLFLLKTLFENSLCDSVNSLL